MNNMKGVLSHSVVCVATLFMGLLAATGMMAQGKTGTTIVFDATTSHGLFASGAFGSDITKQYFGYLKHDISHGQVMLSNKGEFGNDGTGLYTDIANGMIFDGQKLKVVSGDSYLDPYVALVLPKGYRFLLYEWNIDGRNSSSGVKINQVTYEDGVNAVEGNGVTVDKGSSSQIWSETLNGNDNILYFRVTTAKGKEELCLNSIKVVYAIDQSFEGALPSASGGTQISTGVLDLGKFKNNGLGSNYNANSGKGYWAFNKDQITDVQDVAIYNGATAVTPEVVTVDGDKYYVATTNGDYYVEAPQKFRIVGATLNFLRRSLNEKSYSVTEATSIESGSEYLLGDGNGNYLNLNGSSLTNGTDMATATKWTITSSSSGYTIKSGSYYLRNNGNLSTSNSNSNNNVWNYSSSNKGFYQTSRDNDYYIRYNNSAWEASTTSSSLAKPYVLAVTTTTIVAGDFKATPYARDNSVMEGHELKEGDDAYTVELSNLNNDAIHFSISDLAEGQSALYNVNLKLMPLNPEVQNLSVASKFGSDKIQNATSFKSVNYVFNDGEAVTLLAPEGQSTCSVDFLNAYNEEGTLWYSGGGNENTPQGGYSNYFLVNSEADQGGVTDVLLDVTKSPRTEATQAGTNGLKFTNIEELYNTNLKDSVANGPEKLIDNPFSKEEAGYAEATLDVDGAAKTFYIYSADQPTFNIMPEGAGVKHIDYRYYTLKVACKSQKEKPAVTITPIYHETLKAQNHKNTAIASDGGTADKSLTFYGVTVKAKLAEGEGQAQGYLTSNDIVEAIKTAVADKAKEDAGFKFKEGDELRGCLYIDMSSLRRTDNDAFDYVFHLSTADNCLYFMYNGFSRENVTNTMALAADGKTFEADGNVVVYDQQPFFSPYDFNTAQYTVTYEREGTVQKEGGVKERVKNMAVVLPFDVSLDGNGKLKTASDATDNNVTYHNITSSGTLEGVGNQGQGLTYGILADPATGVTTANANSPYYVTTEGDGFTYNIHGAQFRKTGTVASDNNVSFADMTRTNGTWTGHGTYAGVQPKAGKAQDALKGMWYFSQDLFWNADNLVNNDHVNIRPFRAYFTTTDKTSASQAKVVFSLNDIVTGIGSVASGNGNGLAVSAGRGSLTLTAGGATGFGVYTVAGSLVAKGALSAGESRSVALPQGVYVVNGVKVVVK